LASTTQPVRPAALVHPDRPDEKPFTFSFALGRNPATRAVLDGIEALLTRTLYRPFMRFMPAAIVEVALPLRNLPPSLAGLAMVQMSDFHHCRVVPLRVIEEAVAATNTLRPQVVFLTGDFVTSDPRHIAPCAQALGRLRAPWGVYAILGNHDYWTDAGAVAQELRQNGITVLINEARRLADGLWVVGMDDIWSGQPDLARAMAGVPDGAAIILLAHEPDFADQAQGQRIAVQLSGHSHGGQVRLPFTRRPVLPYLAWKYYAGLRQVGDHLVYTNHGVGTMQPPFIFTCQPEITLLRLCG